MSLDWRGEQVREAVLKAARLAVDETTASCTAKSMEMLQRTNKPARSQPGQPPARWTGDLIGSVKSVKATVVGNRIIGYWGSHDKNYALPLEIGTYKMAPRPFLRPVAAEEYPKLAERVKAHYKRIGVK